MKYKKWIILLILAGLVLLLWSVPPVRTQVVEAGSSILHYTKTKAREYIGIGARVQMNKVVMAKASGLAQLEEGVKQAEQLVGQRRQEVNRQEEFIKSCIADMTLEQKLAQLMILTNEKDITEDNLLKLQPGGIILFGADFKGKTIQEVSERVDKLQSFMRYPLFVGVDEEGGAVSRISGLTDRDIPVFKSARQLGSNGDGNEIKEETIKKAKFLQSMGINLNFDPVADVVTKKSAYMYERSAGEDADTAAFYVKAVVETMADENMISCLKHFPGYGNNGNTHKTYIEDKRKLQSYQESDFIPFEEGVEAGADMVMVSHIVMKKIDSDMPASLSKDVHDLLREELDFDGVVMADDLNMQAVLSQVSLEEASGIALAAGNDMIFSADFAASLKGAKEAVGKGLVTEKQIDESVTRVFKLKVKHNLIKIAEGE